MVVTGTFATTDQVRQAIDDLIAAGFPPDSISAVTDAGKPVEELTTTPAEQMGEIAQHAGVGALIGGVAGVAVATLVLPPVGLLVAGPLAFSGALTGGLIGALVDLGHDPGQAEDLAEQVRSGRYLVVVHQPTDSLHAETVLRNAGAEDVKISASP
jgi:uncharacterized membrane protein